MKSLWQQQCLMLAMLMLSCNLQAMNVEDIGILAWRNSKEYSDEQKCSSKRKFPILNTYCILTIIYQKNIIIF